MASPLNIIKDRIKLTRNIEKITNALKHTSSTKMRRLMKGFSQYKIFLQAIYDSLDLLNTTYNIPKKQKTIIYVVSSEIGLCGAYNSRVYSALLAEMQKIEDYEIIHIGKKLRKKLSLLNARELQVPLDNMYSAEFLNVINQEVKWITHLLKDKKLSSVIVIGHKFINQLTQKVECFKLIPFDLQATNYPPYVLETIEFVPSKAKLLDSLIPFYLSATLRSAIFESLLCIEAMRNIAMDNATRNAREFIEQLTLEHNRARQAKITQEIIEIVSGANGG